MKAGSFASRFDKNELAHLTGDPPALPGRQRQFDICGSPSRKLREVSRQAHFKGNPGWTTTRA